MLETHNKSRSLSGDLFPLCSGGAASVGYTLKMGRIPKRKQIQEGSLAERRKNR